MMSTYQPFKIDNLFYQLAMTPPTEHGILEFANKFGLLNGVARAMEVDNPGWDEIPPLGLPTKLEKWIDNINHLRQTLTFWEIYRMSGGQTPVTPPWSVHTDPEIEMGSVPVAQALGWEISRGINDEIGAVPSITNDDTLDIKIRPRDLIGAIWLEFAQAVESGTWKNCEWCGAPFQFERRTAKYCSKSHKQAASDKRRGVGAKS